MASSLSRFPTERAPDVAPTRPGVVALVVGSVTVGVYLVTASVAPVLLTRPHYLVSGGTGAETRWLSFIPVALAALGLLVAGLVAGLVSGPGARRWWLAPIVPVVVIAGAWWWFTWREDLPQHIAAHHWTIRHAEHLSSVYGAVWHVATSLLLVAGWGLIRRTGWRWALALIPAAGVIGIVEWIEHATFPQAGRIEPGPNESFEHALRGFAHSYRTWDLASLALSTVAVVGCIWLCLLAERLRPTPVATASAAGPPDWARARRPWPAARTSSCPPPSRRGASTCSRSGCRPVRAAVDAVSGWRAPARARSAPGGR